MSQFDKEIFIVVDPADPSSFEDALRQYRLLLDSDEAFDKGNQRLLNVEFVHPDGSRLQPADAGKQLPQLERAVQRIRQQALPTSISDGQPIYLSEALLFAAALNYPELKPALHQTSLFILDYARRRNDSADMNVDDEFLFGLEALYLLALDDPAQLWRFTSFIIPYWDNEHHRLADGLMLPFLQQHGWDDNLLRAYLWCDNPGFRSRFHLNEEAQPEAESLYQVLQNDAQRYQQFREQLHERLMERPLLAYHGEQSYDDTEPVLSFYQSLDADWPVEVERDDDEAWLDEVNQQPFQSGTLESEAMALEQQIESANVDEDPLVVIALAHMEDEADDINDEPPRRQTPAEQMAALNDRAKARSFSDWLGGLDRYDIEPHSCRLPDELADQFPQVLNPDRWPVRPGTLYYAWHSYQRPEVAADTRRLLFNWIEQNLMPSLCDTLAQACRDGQLDESVRQYILAGSGSDHASARDWLAQHLSNDAGTLGDRISNNQPGYSLFFQRNGFQAGAMLLFQLQVAQQQNQISATELLESVQRLWRLLLDLAPQRMLRKTLRIHSQYPLLHGIDDEVLEHQLYQQLEACGVDEAQLAVFEVISDQRVSHYRPAHPRFWQRYIAKLDHFAEVELNGGGMLAAHARKQYLAFLDALQRREDCDRIQFCIDLQSRHAATDPGNELHLPDWLDSDFEQALTHYLIDHSVVDDNLDWDEIYPARQKVGLETAQRVLAYLNEPADNPDRSELQHFLAKHLAQDLSSRTNTETLLGPQYYLWTLLDERRSNRLVTLMLNHGRRGLKLLERQPMEPAYVAAQITSGNVEMEQRWSHPVMGHDSIRDPDVSAQLQSDTAAWVLGKIDHLDIPPAMRVALAVDYDVFPYLSDWASKDAFPPLDKVLNAKNRQRLVSWLAEDAERHRPGLESLKSDRSRAVGAVVARAFNALLGRS
ncbi:hypothetical protein BGP77_11865 [Saccharospirillum sp. MSK14-1]|uniref:hypothetical protein n=1 Tax=Saccharospirillum sp. MSK14-1 TaxID=1897632 RepID=UPI000D372F5A|nr:hypothetical protein [Saccharospirillum sp. MSK14-1]PTY38402.1 hypothetical protein BGP77_11865 [Saccharospirillum sp. MSK14-1]